MRSIVDASRLTVTVPLFDRVAASRDLWLVTGAIGADEINHRPRAVARDEVATIARVFRCRHHRARDVKPFPAESLKHRRQDRDDLVAHQGSQKSVHILEVRWDQLIQVPTWQVLKADVETFILGAISRSSRAHIWLDSHEQDGIEAFG